MGVSCWTKQAAPTAPGGETDAERGDSNAKELYCTKEIQVPPMDRASNSVLEQLAPNAPGSNAAVYRRCVGWRNVHPGASTRRSL